MAVFSLALSATALVLSLLALRAAVRSANLASELRDLVAHSDGSRIASIERQMAELLDTMTELANRVKMQRVRQAASHATSKSDRSDGLPDPYRDPDGWRAAMNSRLARAKVNL